VYGDILSGISYFFSHIDFSRSYVPVSICTFLVAGALTFFLLRRETKDKFSLIAFIDHCFPWIHWKTKSPKVDIVLYFISKYSQKWIAITSTFVVASMAAVAASFLQQRLNFDHQLSVTPVVVVTLMLLMFCFADLGSYVSHFIQHKVPILWEFHKVHHSATFLTPFTTYRFHPIGNLLDGLFIGIFLAIPVGIAEFLYRLTYLELIAMSGGINLFFTLLLMTSLQHSHFSISFGLLDWIFISPRMHQVHHSVKQEHWGKNLGSRLSIWDWCFGTGLMLPKDEILKFGIGTVEDDRGTYGSIWWCYVGPLVNCYNLVKSAITDRIVEREQKAHNQRRRTGGRLAGY
jgi:sterol desaturase/sphingolipid hydroxylase (fatty acid hydroxylase superfamily)